MPMDEMLKNVRNCFDSKFEILGATPQGVYWNSVEAQEIRFAQLLKLCEIDEQFTLLDYGCGYGALAAYMSRMGYDFRYLGFDISEAMVAKAREVFSASDTCRFVSAETQLRPADFAVESGIFNLKLDASDEEWTAYVLQTLDKINELGRKGFAFNMLTKYSDADRMQPDLYYADPCFFFDYCKRNYSQNVALLHDYELYDFTILVRK